MASRSQLTKNTLGLHAIDNCVLMHTENRVVVSCLLLLNISGGSWFDYLLPYSLHVYCQQSESMIESGVCAAASNLFSF